MINAYFKEYISPATMIPNGRLASLLKQAQAYQISTCLYHSSDDNLSLLSDHVCDRSEFPSVQSQVLQLHKDEVWFVQFSHSGLRLASASKDTTVIIWDLQV